MPNDEIIITNPKPKFASSPIILGWRNWMRMHSLYVFGLLAFLPDILTYMIAQGWFDPASQSIAFKVVAGLGVFARLYQRKPEPPQ